MDEIRRDPHVEGRAALIELGRGLVWAGLATAVWIAVHSYWPEEWTEPDESTRDRIVLIACGVLGLLAVLTLGGGLLHVHRWRKARRWERMLDDPATAHLVPPLAAHLKSAPSAASGFALIGGCILAGTVAVGLITYGALARAGRVPAVDDASGDDLSGSFVKWGALLLLFAVFLGWRVRRWRVARRIEELSSDPSIAPRAGLAADVAVRRSAAIPDLDVVFDGDGTSSRRAIEGLDRSTTEPLHILYLRLFDNVAGTTRFTRSPWRRYGYIHLLRSAAQVEAEELEVAEDSGSFASLFITTPEQLDAALACQATGREDDPRPKGLIRTWRWTFDHQRGRYPVRALLCHGSFWKAAVDLLLARMDLVALDLAGYRPEHRGTRYELQRVIDRYPIEHVILLADPMSDRRFLAAQVEAAWAQMADGSPNAGAGARTLHVAVGQ
jgi:multisubunit Na+/H+ antiporter MnhB subunit